jgi:hypothetical protein
VGENRTAPAFTVKMIARVADVRPNAPLLKRLVRHPYRMEGVRGKRSVFRGQIPWADLHREAIHTIASWMGDLRVPAAIGNPVRGLDRRLIARERRLPVESWLVMRTGSGR